MRKAFGKTLMKLAEKDENIFLLTGDVEQEMSDFKTKYPHRFYNLGLCEQSIISMAAGMCIEGIRPIVYSITPFLLERPFEQIKIDIDEQNLPVILIGYSDYPTHGPTHRCLDDQGLCKLFKNIVSFFPRNSMETEKSMIEAYLLKKPSIICLKKETPHIL
jgi:transketolase